MNVSLYEISADFLKALDGLEVDEETGEITNFDAVEALNAQFEDKAESVACYIKNPVSYTHLDVYKRQLRGSLIRII